MKRIWTIIRNTAVGVIALAITASAFFAIAQQYNFLNIMLVAHVLGTQGGVQPTVTNGTLTANSSDWAGQETCSSTTCSMTFAIPFNVIPWCVATPNNATEVLEDAVTKTGQTFSGSGSINGTVISWVCIASSAN